MDVSGNVNPVAAVPADSFGAIKSMRLAKLSPGNINYANAHATSTLVAHGPKNKLLRLSLMDVRGRIIVSLAKDAIDHLFEAAGSVEPIFITQ